MKKYREKIMQVVFLIAACISIVAVALICIFLFANGFPAIVEIGPLKFLGGMTWKPTEGQYGIFPMIIGSIYVTGIAILVGVPIGLFCAVFMAKFCPRKLYKILKPAISLLAGIPSIVYGFFGLVVIVPIMQQLVGTGKNVLTAGILLGIMILPTIIEISESSLRAVPQSYYEGSLALGATHERSVFMTVVPAAKSGIMAAVIHGRHHSGHRQSHWRDHGSCHDRRKPAGIAQEPVCRRADDDGKYCHGNGLCRGSAP